jgi:hypothetical protein
MGQRVIALSHHLFCCTLCAPAALGLDLPPAIALALLRHGALCELAWELADFGHLVAERIVSSGTGIRVQPRGTLRFLLAHHALQWAFVIPMNVHFSNFSGYHELLFLLQVAATMAAMASFCGQAFDASMRRDLGWLSVLNGVTFVVMVYARWVHYWYSFSKCLERFYEDESYALLLIGSLCGGLLMPYIGASFIRAQFRKWWRFVDQYWSAVAATSCASIAHTLPPAHTAVDDHELPMLLTSRSGQAGASGKGKAFLAPKHTDK